MTIMKTINYTPNTSEITIASDSTSEIVMIGRLSAKLPNAQVGSDGPNAVITMSVADLVKLAANGKIS